jgi:hypothetical protein
MADKEAKGFKLVPADIPRRQRTSFYTEIITDFQKLKDSSALVEGTGKKPVTLVQGLRKALEAEGVTDIGVVQRGSEVFLVKED